MAERTDSPLRSFLDELPLDRLRDEVQDAFAAATDRAVDAAGSKVSDVTDRLTDITANGGVTSRALVEGGKAAATGGSPLLGALKGGVLGVKDKAKEALSGNGSGGSSGSGGKNATKSTNIVEQIDVGVPISVAYNQWTQFQDYSGFMKKVENVEQKSDEKLDFKAKILWSHRTWEATILEQVPDEKIVWRSKGPKGHVDGAVTFHDLDHNHTLTRILLVLEYYPQGLFERVGNIWRAQGRRARLELKHFRRHLMTHVLLEPEEVEGWRGEIRQGEVVRGHGEEPEEDEAYEDQYDEDEYAEREEPEDEEAADEYDEAEDEGEPEDEYDEDEYADDEGEEPDDEEPADEYDEAEDEAEREDEYDEDDEDEYTDDDEYDEGEEPDDEEPDDEYDEAEDEAEPEDEYEDSEYEEEPDERRLRRVS